MLINLTELRIRMICYHLYAKIKLVGGGKMKYVNSNEVLPDELIDEIRKYVEGVYLYIPVQEENKYNRSSTKRREGIEKRNIRIYDDFLRGITYDEIAKKYFLSVKSIRRIVLERKRVMVGVKDMICKIAERWDIDIIELQQITHSSWDINGEYVMKEYHKQSEMLRNIELMNILYDEGIPVPRVVQAKNGKAYVVVDDKSYLLTTKLSGSKLENIKDLDGVWFNKFGVILANLHKGFRQCEETVSFWNNNMLEEMQGWVTKNLVQYKPEYITEKDRKEAINQLTRVYKDLPKQLIHRDVHVGNFLFNKEVFTGYIDFDLSQRNIRIFDICYFLLGINCLEMENGEYDSRWFNQIVEVCKGYNSVNELTIAEKESMTCVMKNIELLFVAYFLDQQDDILARDAALLFEFVKENEVRITEDIKYI